ncbi:uncharacterized protein [Amphiura filiformis]|uniref:uncharacterized protein n=1 Tax=Amphiura filiformis TaxID=82378 RepID=UPI003B20D816
MKMFIYCTSREKLVSSGFDSKLLINLQERIDTTGVASTIATIFYSKSRKFSMMNMRTRLALYYGLIVCTCMFVKTCVAVDAHYHTDTQVRAFATSLWLCSLESEPISFKTENDIAALPYTTSPGSSCEEDCGWRPIFSVPGISGLSGVYDHVTNNWVPVTGNSLRQYFYSCTCRNPGSGCGCTQKYVLHRVLACPWWWPSCTNPYAVIISAKVPSNCCC